MTAITAVLILPYGRIIIVYKPISEGKWLSIKPINLPEKYYKYELNKDGKPFTEKIFKWHEIIVSEINPNRL